METNKKRIAILLFISLFILSGCASIFNSGRQSVQINTSGGETANVKVRSSSDEVYHTTVPTTIHEFPSSFQHTLITLDDPCFHVQEIRLDRKLDKTYWLNIFNFYGFAIDYFSGNLWQLDNEVTLDTLRLDPQDESCNRRAKVDLADQTLKTNPPRVKHRSNMLGVSLFSAYSMDKYVDDPSSGGGQLAYMRKLSPSVLMNVQFQTFNRAPEDMLMCEKQFGCGIYSVEHDSLMWSLRHYVVPATDIYAGLGFARVRITTETHYFGLGNEKHSDKRSSSTRFNTAFVELGWAKRFDEFGVNFNMAVDFADLKLISPKINSREKTLRQFEDRALAEEYDNRLRAMSTVTGFSLGLSYWF